MSARIDLDALERLAAEARRWQSDLPWSKARYLHPASIASIAGIGESPASPSGDFADACDPETVAALVRAVRAAEHHAQCCDCETEGGRATFQALCDALALFGEQ